MKTCTKCRAERDVVDFSKNAQSKDGLRPDCKACCSARAKIWTPSFVTKICTSCNEDKSAIEYSPRRGSCRVCETKRSFEYRQRPGAKERQAAADKKRQAENKDALAKMRQVWQKKNAASRKEQTYAWRLANPEVYHAINAKSRAKHKARVLVSNGERRTVEKRATPTWANKSAMKAFYETAQGLNMLLGEWHHVDHIVPLRSRLVCGLHVEHNMEVIPATENHLKNNRYWPDMPDNGSSF